MDRLLAGGDKLNSIGKARLVYVKAQLYRYLESKQPKKKDEKGQVIVDTSPKRSDELMQQLTTEYKPEDYSAALLAVVGDHLYKAGEKEKAAQSFNRLLQFYPQSAFVDWGAVGLGQMALEDKDFETALAKFTIATDEFPGAKYGEALLGKSRALVELKRFGDAEKDPGNSPEKMLKEILGDKTYPPEVKAEATWLLGEVKFAQQAYADAYNYFQRLYVSFLKFPKWVARGYLRAGETKEALQKYTDAKDVYKEAVETPKIMERIKGEADFQKIQENYRKL
jgi:TolA-binding protein